MNNPVRHPVLMARQVGITLTLAVFLTACSGHGSSSASNDKAITGEETASNTFHDSLHAATSPLDDLGLRKQDIPEALVKVAANPYERPKPFRCATLKGEVAELDTLLGPDIDAPVIELTDGEQAANGAADFIHDGVVGLVRSHTSFIPFRGIIRRITGADKYEKQVAAAYEAGKLRRAYLKGLAQVNFGSHCIYSHTEMVKKDDPKADDDTPIDHNAKPDAGHLQVATKL